MGLPTEILKFFEASKATRKGGQSFPHAIADFGRDKDNIDYLLVRKICQKFQNEGLLVYAGLKYRSPLSGDSFYNFGYDIQHAEYGSYDFLVEGFNSIRSYFSPSVRPVIVIDKNYKEDIGTCFIISENVIVTAFHCIEEMECVKILDLNNNTVKAKNIWRPSDHRKDIAIIELEGTPFVDIPHFKIAKGEILDQVLTMGYPPIPGFDTIQFSEIASINTMIKSSMGDIVGQDKSYLDGQEYLLINAKVKGGNSGGPIINKLGFVIGMLVHIPTDPNDAKKLDILGYGIAIPAIEISEVIEQIKNNHDDIQTVQFENLNKGFKTKK